MMRCLCLLLSLLCSAGAVETLTYAGSGSVGFLVRALMPNGITSLTSGSNDAVAALTEGRAILVGLSRQPTADELELVRATRGTLPTTRTLGRAALGIFVHRDNPCPNISTAQLAAAMRGALTWAELGGTGELGTMTVRVVVNHPSSGSTTMVVDTILHGAPLPTTVQCELVGSSVTQAAAVDPAVLAIAALHQATPAVRVVALDGIAPDGPSISDGSYALSRPLVLAWMPDTPPSPALATLIGILDDPASARILAEFGVR